MDADIAIWQREGPLFCSYDDPSLPADRLCIETQNVYHHERMVQVGPYYVHRDVYKSYYTSPKPEDYQTIEPAPRWSVLVLAVIGLMLIGFGIGLLFPIGLF
jgi:hypothetical protein